jgi:hypothetical protein
LAANPDEDLELLLLAAYAVLAIPVYAVTVYAATYAAAYEVNY